MTAAANPALIPGLVSWHNASANGGATVTKDGSNLVSQWDSIIGTYPATATTTARPTWTAAAINGKAALLFNGSSNVLNINSLAGAFTGTDIAHSVFAVFKYSSVGVYNTILCAENTSNYDGAGVLIWSTSTPNYAIRRADNTGAAKQLISGTPNTSVRILSSVFSGTAENLYINGAQVGAADTDLDVGALTINKVSIGAYYNPRQSWLNGYLCEILVYSRALTTTERQLVEEYLTDQWISTTHTNFLINYPSTILSGTTAWNCGREPKYPWTQELDAPTSSARWPNCKYTLTWDGVSDAQRALFVSGVASYADLTPFYLVDVGYYALYGRNYVQARLVSYEIIPRIGSNTISATFEALI